MPKELPLVKLWGGSVHLQAFIKEWTENWRNPDTADFTIVTDKDEIPCHRIVLMTHSLTLKKIIRLLDPPQNRVALDNLPGDIVEKVLEYMYKGEMLIEMEDIQGVMVVASYLQLDELLEWVSDNVDPFLKIPNLISWREMAEHIDDPRVAMDVKRLIVKHFDEFGRTEQVLKLDALEIGKYMREFDIERIEKDLLVDAALRWMRYAANDDALAWLTADEFEDILSRIESKWVLDDREDTPDSIRSRTYCVCRCLNGLAIDIAIQKYQDRTIHPYLIKMAQIKAEELADKRAPQHLKDPPRDNRYTLADCFHIFKEAIKENYAKKGEDISDRAIEEKYDILMGSKKLRLAVGPRVLKVIQMKNCTRSFLERLRSSNTDEFSQLVTESDGVKEAIDSALNYMNERKARAENWNEMSPLRLVNIGGHGRDAVKNYISYDGQSFETYIHLPDYTDRYLSRQCAFPQGFIVVCCASNKWFIYNHHQRYYRTIPPCPVRRNRFAMTYYQGRIYTVSGMTGKWDWKSTAQYYDLEKNEWHHLPDGPAAYMTEPFVFGLGNFIYVFSQNQHLCKLDIETHEWKELKQLHDSVPSGACCTDGQRIWVAGGFRSLCYVYDPETNEWERKMCPLFQQEYPGLCFHMGLLFMIGGKDCSFVEEYDPNTDEWIESTLQLEGIIEGSTAMQVDVQAPEAEEKQLSKDRSREFRRREELFGKRLYRPTH